ncbi:hypothetical protein A0H81_08055 [Grifola frondosa]|uniref:Uncharacterized protein n=1 Tax=Grifola frondosa TaxID=5627 RepID=A0A1C7M792_GRIFR|nr:hypothetical protein A0H81_08055 [Grifola frondosa]
MLVMFSDNGKEYIERKEHESASDANSRGAKQVDTENINVKLANPLAHVPHDQLMTDAAAFAGTHGLGHLAEQFQKGALVAQDPTSFESLSQLSEEDKTVLRRELTHRWAQPAQLYYLVILCSLSAAVQGMDQSAINGANLFFASQFGIDPSMGDTGRNQWLFGLVNSAPYVSENPTYPQVYLTISPILSALLWPLQLLAIHSNEGKTFLLPVSSSVSASAQRVPQSLCMRQSVPRL